MATQKSWGGYEARMDEQKRKERDERADVHRAMQGSEKRNKQRMSKRAKQKQNAIMAMASLWFSVISAHIVRSACERKDKERESKKIKS